jgi:hypothetical protein
MRVDYRKELSLAFGDYCEVFDGMDNTSKQRSVPCIALYPCCNATGSWIFYSLESQKRLRRTTWKKMVTSEDIVKRMNALVEGSSEENGETVEKVLGEQIAEKEIAVDPVGPDEAPSEDPVLEEPREEPSEDLISDLENRNDVPELEPAGDDESDDEAEDDETSDSEDEEEQDISGQQLRRSERLRARTRRPVRYAVHTKLKAGSHNDEEINTMIAKAEKEEIELVFQDLKAVQIVRKEEIPNGVPTFGTHLFTIEKFKADGSTDKCKSQLVAHGNEQDTSLYPDRSSPTAQMHAIMKCLTVAACNPQYEIAKLNVKGAFIQTEMSGTPVYVKCTGKLRNKILKIFPSMETYLGSDRILYGILRKALYGCIQASRLWYLTVTIFKGHWICEFGDGTLCI